MSFEQALANLQESIEKDAFLRDADFEEYIIARSLAFHKNDVHETLKALTNCAKWHKEILGHQSKRVSIVHIHAFLLVGVLTFLPTAKDNNGRPLMLFRIARDSRAIPKQHYGNFSMWFHFWNLRQCHEKNEQETNYNLLVDALGFKLKNFRPSEFKCIDEATSCRTVKTDVSAVFIFNASKAAVRLWTAVMKIIKSVVYSNTHFLKPAELSNFITETSQIPVDFGGLRSMEDTHADMEEFIQQEYAREGLRL
ncbi:hypothetical protein BDR26DRAFT_864045 [Obelidium mucronatum]|nr:hypothetical protein BDR26DRAFT_864045 [Obelidium mucronatum]